MNLELYMDTFLILKFKKGKKVKPVRAIGKVNESLEGKIPHFEIWNEKNYQNPELWLARK